MPLTSPSQSAGPLSFYFAPGPVELRFTVVQPEILVETAQHPRELLLLIAPFPMHMLLEPFFGLGQELAPALFAWNPYQGELSTLIRSTYVLETQEVKRVRFIPGLRKVPSNKSSETHHPRLFFCQFQSELPESLRQVLLEPRRIASVLEVSHEVVSKPG